MIILETLFPLFWITQISKIAMHKNIVKRKKMKQLSNYVRKINSQKMLKQCLRCRETTQYAQIVLEWVIQLPSATHCFWWAQRIYNLYFQNPPGSSVYCFQQVHQDQEIGFLIYSYASKETADCWFPEQNCC